MTPNMKLVSYDRPDRKAEAAAMEVMVQAFDPAFGEAWTAAQLGGMMSLPGMTLVIASLDAATLGFALTRLVLDESELLLLAVAPQWRNKSIGSILVDHCITSARREGAKTMHLEVRSTNNAVELYQKLGFAHVNTRPGYYRGGDGKLFDAYSFQRDI
ncbi:GNAT family N-acetyltransferase [Sphingobium aquiterrae]|uniref:GNAT family N-acetyltransferase n=1 Tax=Sphingobium aquiterrae TaxID=2038656 RepID=UPI003015A065